MAACCPDRDGKTGQAVDHIRPNFERPPLVEQAIVAVFEPIEQFSITDYGLFWSDLRNDFPEVTSTDPLNEQVETFDQLKVPDRSFQFIQTLPLPRAMFRSNDGGELIQLQPNLFGFNWSRIDGGHYPRSEKVMARFEELFTHFCEYVEKMGIGAIKLKQCELTNLNIIPVEDFGSGYEDMIHAFRVDPLDFGLPFLKAETYTRTRQHQILDDSGNPVGRLHTAITPVISKQNGGKAFRLELTARSGPNISSWDEMRSFFAIGRSAINGVFCATVTEKMRTLWGEKDAQ